MKHILLSLVCLLSMSSGVFAIQNGVKHTQERVITLPQDQGKWYVSLFGDPNDPKFQLLQQWFQLHSGLDNLRGQTHFNVYPTTSTRYQRYAKTLPGLPCIRVQNSEGVVASEFWNEYIPMSGESLYQGIRGDLQDKASWGCLRRRRCRPKPQPTPEPVPTPEPILAPVDTPPVLAPEPQKPSFPWLLAVLSALAGGGLGVAQGYKNEHIDTPAV